MRSIPLVIAWETVCYRPWGLIAAALGSLALPVLLLAALRQEGTLLRDDPSMLHLHVTVMQLSMVCFGAAVLAAQGRPGRFYAVPATNSAIVAWQLFPAMLLMALESLAATAIVNAMFQLQWPLWGPAMFLAVSLAAAQAVVWLTEKSAWLPPAMFLVAGFLGTWFKSRYGPVFSPPDHYWQPLTPGEVATMLGIAAAAFATGTVAIRRNRCGEPLRSPRIASWFERVLDTGPAVGHPFADAARSQLWYEWRQKGWVMPAAVVCGLGVGSCLWLLFSRDPQELLAGFVAGGWLLSAAGVVAGMLLGNCGTRDGRFEIGPFLATRPMATADLARTILKATVGSVILAWVIWAAAFAALCLVLWASTNTAPRLAYPPELGWWYFPATLLCSWTVTAAVASILLAGRGGLFAKLVCTVLVVHLSVTLLSSYALSHDAQRQLGRAAAAVVGIAALLATVTFFVAARRRGLIGQPTVYAAASLWAAIGAAMILGWMQRSPQPLPLGLLYLGASALAVAPLAAAPLALAWNRIR